jgi:hypothetical protein
MNSETQSPQPVSIETMTQWSEAAMRLASQDAIALARTTGTPVILWQEGEIRRFRVVGDQLVPWSNDPASDPTAESAA